MLSIPALRLLHILRLRGTLTATAEQLHLSRSAASHQLAAIQRTLGIPLTEKVGRGLRLTEAGVQLAEHAGRVLSELEEASAAVERLRGQPSGAVRLGVVQTIAVTMLPGMLTLLRQNHSELRVESRGMSTEDALVAVTAGELDLAVVPSYDPAPLAIEGGLTKSQLFRDPIRLAVHENHRLASRPAVPVAELADEPWIGGKIGGNFANLGLALCRQAGFDPEVVHRSDDYVVVGALVAAGHGIAVIPDSADLGSWPGIAVTSLDAPDAGRDIVVLVRAGSRDRPAIQAVVRAMRTVAVRAG